MGSEYRRCSSTSREGHVLGCLLDAAQLRFAWHVPPGGAPQERPRTQRVAQLAWEYSRKSWPRVYFDYPRYKVWVGLELQLDYDIKISPSSNLCWPKLPQYQNFRSYSPLITKKRSLVRTHHQSFFGIKRQGHRSKCSFTVYSDGHQQSLSLPDVKKLKTVALKTSKTSTQSPQDTAHLCDHTHCCYLWFNIR